MTVKLIRTADVVPGDMLTLTELIIGVIYTESGASVHIFNTTNGNVTLINCCSKEGLWSTQKFMDA